MSSPRPYLLNQAGGIVPIRSFKLSSGEIKIEPVSESPVTGVHQLVYRCPSHANFDIKRSVSCDGAKWSLIGQSSVAEDGDVCYPELESA